MFKVTTSKGILAKDVSYQVAIALHNMATIRGFENVRIVENFDGSLIRYFRELRCM